MDISYMLLLKDFRTATMGMLNFFFLLITKFGESYLPYILCLWFYWAFDKNLGKRLMLTLSGAIMLNGLTKLTACVYRPWIRSPQINPAGNAKVTATGYSFSQRTHDPVDRIVRRSGLSLPEEESSFGSSGRSSAAGHVFQELSGRPHAAGCYCRFHGDRSGSLAYERYFKEDRCVRKRKCGSCSADRLGSFCGSGTFLFPAQGLSA